MSYEPPFNRTVKIDALCMEIAELVGMLSPDGTNNQQIYELTQRVGVAERFFEASNFRPLSTAECRSVRKKRKAPSNFGE